MNRPAAATFSCDLKAQPAALFHCWEHTVGSDHALMALRADWQDQLKKAHEELGFGYVRFHGILDDDIGTLIREHEKLIYSFFNSDRIFDFLLSIGMKPFVELSFMPTALASGNATVFKYKGNITPPCDYGEWKTLVRKLVGHWVQRYGTSEVRQWFFEVWNEPNLPCFWAGTQSDYFRLYKHTAEAIKDVDNNLRVGGPATANNAWVPDFLSFCDANGIPVDFVSTHHYPTDAFGKPGDDTETQLSKSRRSVLSEDAHKVVSLARGLPLYYTEWNSSSNPRDPMHDDSYAAAFAIKTSLEVAGYVQAHSYWTFSDIFEEDYFPSIPFHGGFGLLNLHGIPKPAYRAHELLREVGKHRLPLDGSHPTVDVWAVQNVDKVAVLCTNWALPRHPVKSERIRVLLHGATPPAGVSIRRIDAKNANAKREWRRMGEPEYLSEKQVQRLRKASQLRSRQQHYRHAGDTLDVSFTLAPQSVAALDIQFFPHQGRRSPNRQHRGFHTAASLRVERDGGCSSRDA